MANIIWMGYWPGIDRRCGYTRDPACHEAIAVMRQHRPYAWGRRSSGFPVTHWSESFSFRMGMGFHLLHMEEKAVGWGPVEVKAEMKSQTKPSNCCQSEMGRRRGNCWGIILGNTLSFSPECPHFSLKAAAGGGIFYIALLVNTPFL